MSHIPKILQKIFQLVTGVTYCDVNQKLIYKRFFNWLHVWHTKFFYKRFFHLVACVTYTKSLFTQDLSISYVCDTYQNFFTKYLLVPYMCDIHQIFYKRFFIGLTVWHMSIFLQKIILLFNYVCDIYQAI